MNNILNLLTNLLKKYFNKSYFIMSIFAIKIKPDNFGIGRRKTSVAKVLLVPGTGEMVINHVPGEKYLQFNSEYIKASKSALIFLSIENVYDIYATVHGGGIRAQAEAIKLGVARALDFMSSGYQSGCNVNPQFRKYGSLLTRDSRRKERKKYGLKKARKAPQFSKR